MTNEKVLDVLKVYTDLLEKHGRIARRIDEKQTVSWLQQECHLLWMCGNAALFISEDRIEKAMRWLGFIQGALWVLGLRTIEQMKRDNMPDGSNYDPDNVKGP